MSQSNQTLVRDDYIAEAIAGLLTLGVSTSVGLTTVVWGQGVVAGQFSTPIIGGVLWPVSVGATILLTLLVMLLSTMVLVGMVNIVATPSLAGRAEYSLIGGGGLFGTAVGVTVSLADRFVGESVLPMALPADVGGSIAALALLAGPAAFIYYRLWRPSPVPIGQARDEDPPPDPEVIRERRTRWSEDADPNSMPGPLPASSSPKQSQVPNAPEPSNGAGLSTADLEFHWQTETDVSFEDVGGMTELKNELDRDIIKPLTSGREEAEALNIPVPNMLLHGPPGTGKTFIAKGLATELGLPFLKLSGSDLQSKWINESPQKIATLFNEAKKVAEEAGGAVVFVDELDSVLKARDHGGSSHNEDNKVVAEFLNHLQETDQHDVVFIGATNRPGILDDAGVRSGRIDKTIEIGKPDTESREAIIRAQLRDRPSALQDHHIRCIAEQTSGYTGADIESLVLQAARHSAYVREDDSLQWADFKTVLDDA